MSFSLFIKKFIGFFLQPFGIVVTLFALGLYFFFAKKESRAKLFLLLSISLLLLFAYPPFANFLVAPLESKYAKFDATKLNNSHKSIYIHVLGNGHTTDASQPISSQLSDAGVKRVLEGVLLYKTLKNAKLIFTGYEGDTDTPNALMNAKLALALGVKAEDMIINGVPEDTKEEALFAKTLVKDEPYILVTSATHMPRAMLLFESLEMHPIAAPTDFHKEKFIGWLRAPRPIYFYISSVALHEYLGLLWAKIRA